jgi:hypothetical protein
MWRWPGTFLTAGKQRSRPSRANMEPQQLRQVSRDRYLPVLSTVALANGDDALNQADILDTKQHQLGSSGAGFQQRLQHQTGAAILSVPPVEGAKSFLNGQPIDFAPMFRDRPKPGALPGSFEMALLCA